jgi:hypothetical protein
MSRSRIVALLLAAATATACATGGDPGRPTSDAPASATSRATGTTTTATQTDALPEVLADGPRPPTGPADAVRILRAAARVVDDRSASPTSLAAAGHGRQLVVRELGVRPAWERRVLAALPPAARRDVRDDVAARRALRSMHPAAPADLADELPAWRVVPPPPVERLLRFYREAERRYGVDWEHLAAIHLVETTFGRIRGTSSAGAQGPMQFLPTTWDIYGAGGDIRDPRDAILAAARLLRAHGFARDHAGALRHYNNSAAYVRAVGLHAGVMARHPRALWGYHAWQVYYLTRRGSVWLEEGYAARHPVPVDRYLADHPEALPH